MYGTDLVDGLRELVKEGNLSADDANVVAEHFGDTFTVLARQRVEILVTVEIDPSDESDDDELANNVSDRVSTALSREFGGGYYGYGSTSVDVSVDSVQDA